MAVARVGNTGTKINQRGAEEAALAQNKTRAEQMLQNQNDPTRLAQTYIDPTTGLDTRTITGGNPSVASDVQFTDEFGRTVKGINYSQETPVSTSGGILTTTSVGNLMDKGAMDRLRSQAGEPTPSVTQTLPNPRAAANQKTAPRPTAPTVTTTTKLAQDIDSLKARASMSTDQRITDAGFSDAEIRKLDRIKSLGEVTGTEFGYMVFNGQRSDITEYEWRNAIQPRLAQYDAILGGKDVQDINSQIAQKTEQFRSAAATERTAEKKVSQNPAYIAFQSQIDESKQGFDTFKTMLSGLSPELQAAFSPTLSALQREYTNIDSSMADIIGTLQTDQQIEQGYEGERQRALDIERRFLDLADKNKETTLKVAEYNRDMLQIDKQILEHKAAEDEQKTIAANVQREKTLRRQLNALGINTDVQGLDYLNKTISEGQQALASLRTANNLNMLKANLAIGQGYRLDVENALNAHEGAYLDITTKTDDKLDTIQNSISLAKSERAKEIRATLKWGAENKAELEMKTADTIKEAQLKMIELQAAAAKDAKKEAITTKDKLSYEASLRSEINNNKVITQANDVDGFYGSLEAGFNRYTELQRQIASGEIDAKSGNAALGPSQTAVIGALARILDPGSVVRNEEYERQTKGQAFVNEVQGWFEKLNKGGVGLTATDIKEIKTLADELHNSWESRFQENMQKYVLSINDWNRAYPDTPINYESVIPVDRVHLPESTIEKWRNDAGYDTSGTENASGTPGFLPAESAPPGGYRTDRHNNPTAFVTGLAKQAGLIEGVDYVPGDKFPNGNGITARLLGDPIDLTVRVLDKVGFYTQGGKQRWTHTAMSKEAWDSLTIKQKKDIVMQMYQREGGTGILVQGMQNKDVAGDATNYPFPRV